jgi:hypothetical protein
VPGGWQLECPSMAEACRLLGMSNGVQVKRLCVTGDVVTAKDPRPGKDGHVQVSGDFICDKEACG